MSDSLAWEKLAAFIHDNVNIKGVRRIVWPPGLPHWPFLLYPLTQATPRYPSHYHCKSHGAPSTCAIRLSCQWSSINARYDHSRRLIYELQPDATATAFAIHDLLPNLLLASPLLTPYGPYPHNLGECIIPLWNHASPPLARRRSASSLGHTMAL
ncbi:hypothetical protein FKP32DRAFT_1431873 [Trametes sanguinea]|nr:hypothetical protein FKP32DRAFT_1431873 [Trametes sanguinea]